MNKQIKSDASTFQILCHESKQVHSFPLSIEEDDQSAWFMLSSAGWGEFNVQVSISVVHFITHPPQMWNISGMVCVRVQVFHLWLLRFFKSSVCEHLNWILLALYLTNPTELLPTSSLTGLHLWVVWHTSAHTSGAMNEAAECNYGVSAVGEDTHAVKRRLSPWNAASGVLLAFTQVFNAEALKQKCATNWSSSIGTHNKIKQWT